MRQLKRGLGYGERRSLDDHIDVLYAEQVSDGKCLLIFFPRVDHSAPNSDCRRYCDKYDETNPGSFVQENFVGFLVSV